MYAHTFHLSAPLGSESTEELSPERTIPTPFSNFDSFHIGHCTDNGPINSGLSTLASTQSPDYREEVAPSGIGYYCQGDFLKSGPCMDSIQPVDFPETFTENPRDRMSHFSPNVSFRSSSVQQNTLSLKNDIPAEGSQLNHQNRRTLKSRRLPSETVKVLRSWLYQHQDYPYPTDQEREDLERQTGLGKTQILNWFTNARRRKMNRQTINDNANTVDQKLLSPMERWQNSPPESEFAMASDIIRAVENTPYIPFNSDAIRSNSYETCSSHTSNNSHQLGVSSISSYENSHSSCSELASQTSRDPFERSPTPILQMQPRRHRRRMKRSAKRPGKERGSEHRPYQCTFCSESFKSKYDWQRHEKALHLSVDRWNCAPEGGITEINGISSCVFCLAPDADINHLETHNYIGCREKPSEYRSFSRKDHLVQHLRLTHEVPFNSSMNRWQESPTRLLSQCGFCDTQLFSWQERADHLAEHFKKNADMNQWQGCWGFEPHIEKLVENAMPPYLLGQERRTMDPWKAFDTVKQENGSTTLDDTAPNALDRYGFVRAKLTDYLRNQISAGNYPTDEMIQDEARMIAYGDNDPWNQTYADDPAFITAIRNDVGLELWTCIDEED